MTQGRPHTIAQGNLFNRMTAVVPAGWYASQEQPIRFGDDSIPEPDLTVVRGAARDSPTEAPRAGDVSLLIEVSDSTLAEDQDEALQAYAAESIPIYWIINLPDRRIEVHTDPTGTAATPLYRSIRYYVPGDEVPVLLDGREVGRIAVNDILP